MATEFIKGERVDPPKTETRKGVVRRFVEALACLTVIILGLLMIAELTLGSNARLIVRALAAMDNLQVVFGFLRGGAIALLYVFWPTIWRKWSAREQWPEDYAADVLDRGRVVIAGMFLFDVIVINGPIWASLID